MVHLRFRTDFALRHFLTTHLLYRSHTFQSYGRLRYLSDVILAKWRSDQVLQEPR